MSKSTESGNILNVHERSDLRSAEKAIHSGIKDVGENLLKIRDGKWYREKFKTFELYCENKWGFKRSYANRLIRSHETEKNLGTIVPKKEIPTAVTHLAEISQAPEENQVEVLERGNEIAATADRSPIASDYADARDEIAPMPSAKRKSDTKKEKTTKPSKPGTEVVSPAKIIDAFYKPHYPPLCRGLTAAAKACGGEGPNYKLANDALDVFSKSVKKMREGKA